MTLEEKIRIVFLNQNNLLSKIEMLMVIEENYENIMNVVKLDKDLNSEIQQWIFDFYNTYAMYNSYTTAYKVKKQF